MPAILKLNYTHLLLRSAAAQRSDGLLDFASHLKGNVLRLTGEKLLKADLVTEVLVVCQPGLLAITLEAHEPPAEVKAEPAVEITPAAPAAEAVRPGTKRALIIGLLSGKEGASIGDLMTATGWPHTTRAALTGLRKQGHVLTKAPGPDGTTIYRISTAPAATMAA